MNRFPVLAAVWLAVLAAGFAVVFVLGAPVSTPSERLDKALHLVPPVTEAAALESARTVVEIQYPAFTGVEPVVERLNDYGIDHWLVTYSNAESLSGVLVSVVVDSGVVEVVAFP